MPKFYIFVLLIVSTGLGANDDYVAIKDINRDPSLFVDKPIQVVGKVYLSGNYWGRHTWYLVDQQGEKISMTDWAPYELMEPPPGSTVKKPATMRKFVDKHASLSATLRLNTGIYPNMNHPYYLEVKNAVIIVPDKRE